MIQQVSMVGWGGGGGAAALGEGSIPHHITSHPSLPPSISLSLADFPPWRWRRLRREGERFLCGAADGWLILLRLLLISLRSPSSLPFLPFQGIRSDWLTDLQKDIVDYILRFVYGTLCHRCFPWPGSSTCALGFRVWLVSCSHPSSDRLWLPHHHGCIVDREPVDLLVSLVIHLHSPM